jgi:hypothetical protein
MLSTKPGAGHDVAAAVDHARVGHCIAALEDELRVVGDVADDAAAGAAIADLQCAGIDGRAARVGAGAGEN